MISTIHLPKSHPVITALATAPPSDKLLVGAKKGQSKSALLLVYKLGGEMVKSLPFRGKINGIVMGTQATMVDFTIHGLSYVTLLGNQKWQAVRTTPHGRKPHITVRKLVHWAEQEYCYFGWSNGDQQLWRLTATAGTKRHLFQIKGNSLSSIVAAQRSTTEQGDLMILATTGQLGQIVAWSPPSKRVAKVFASGEPLPTRQLALSSPNQAAFVCGNAVRMGRLDGSPLTEIQNEGAPPLFLRWLATNQLVIGCANGEVAIWSVKEMGPELESHLRLPIDNGSSPRFRIRQLSSEVMLIGWGTGKLILWNHQHDIARELSIAKVFALIHVRVNDREYIGMGSQGELSLHSVDQLIEQVTPCQDSQPEQLATLSSSSS